MGGSGSKEEGSYGNPSISRTDFSSPSYGPPVPQQPTQGYEQGSYEIPYAYPLPQQHYPQAPAPAQQYASPAVTDNNRKLDRRYSRIADSYSSLEQVTEALARAGLESSNLIIGIDFTKSNEWTGAKSYNRKSLHHIGEGSNPYQQAIGIIGRTLAAFDEDNLIPCYGFGDASTHDQDVFSFYHEDRFCNGFEEVLNRYKEIIPQLRLAGPTSFAPIIEMAMTIVQQSNGQYHVLVIVADGQVTRSVDTERGQLSPQERKTVEAIVEASKFPLSIILVGVGDGPWDTMKEFDDNIPARAFDNFQFVNFTEIMSKNTPQPRKEAEFALAALMEIPSQYKATIELGILGGRKGNASRRIPLPPPVHGAASFSSVPSFTKPSYPTSFQPRTSFDYVNAAPASTAPSAPSSSFDDKLCPICLTNPKDMAFGCGHQTCRECGQDLQLCPMCRSAIHTRIKLY